VQVNLTALLADSRVEKTASVTQSVREPEENCTIKTAVVVGEPAEEDGDGAEEDGSAEAAISKPLISKCCRQC